jgi:hypothetical protein
MLLVMTMMAVSALDQGAGNLHDSIAMNEEKSADSQCSGSNGCAGGSPAPMGRFTGDERDDFGNGNLAQ